MTKIRCFSVGGLDEIGKNCFVVEVNQDIFVFDCGLKILTGVDLGVNSLIPDFRYLIENQKRIRGLFLTSCNVKNAFALKFLLKNIPDLKIYTTKISKELIFFNNLLTLKQLQQNVHVFSQKTLNFGANKVHLFHTATNLPGSCGFNLETPSGCIFYTGNIIFESNQNQKIFHTEMQELYSVDDKKVLLLVSNVDNVNVNGFITPRNQVDVYLKNALMQTQRHLYLCFDQNDWYKIFQSIKYLNNLKNQTFLFHFFDDYFAKNFKKIMEPFLSEEIKKKIVPFVKNEKDIKTKHVFFLTGNHKWLFSRIARLVNKNQKNIMNQVLTKDDCVLIIGENAFNNELAITKALNDLHYTEANIQFVSNKKIFLMNSGTGDLKLLVNLLKPKYFFPVNAHHRFLFKAKEIILKNNNLQEEDIFVRENGEIITFEDGKWNRKYEFIKINSVFVDNLLNTDIISSVIEERRLLANEGVVLIAFSYQYANQKYLLNSNIDLQTYGLIDKTKQPFFNQIILTSLKNYLQGLNKKVLRETLIINIKKNILKIFEKQINKKPFVFVVIYNRY